MSADRVAAARAEIAQRRRWVEDDERAVETFAGWQRNWLLAVLDAADAVLTRHAQTSDIGLADGDWCPFDGHDYPCADLLAVLDLYAP